MNSPINACMWVFVEYTARVKPLVAVFESVRAAYTKGHSLMRDLRARLEARTGLAWTLHHVVHDAYALGGPAVRRRYFWIASRIPFGVEHPELPMLPTLYDAIGDLQPLELRMQAQPHTMTPLPWSRRLRSPDDTVDGHVTLTNPYAKRIADLADMIDWRPGYGVSVEARRCYETHGRLPDSWRGMQDHIIKRNFDFGFGAIARWPYDAPARVVTGAGPNVALHPSLSRTLTHREVARIMGFPDDWLIEPLAGSSGLGMTWGKGITVDAGRWIAAWVRESIAGRPGTMRGTEVGSREFEVVTTRPRVCAKVDTYSHSRKIGALVTETATPPATPAPVASGESPTAAPTEAIEKASRRGRGRPAETIERDTSVLTAIREGATTRETIAEKTGLDPTRVYQSLWRLRRDGEIERQRAGRDHVWRLAAK